MIKPKKIVPIAPQRNHHNAAGVMYLPSAGRNSCGIEGVVGVDTKLKYQSRPIHITPQMTCAQRNRPSPNDSHTMGPFCMEMWMAMTTTARIVPAITVLRRLAKNAAMAVYPLIESGDSLPLF